MQPHEIEAVEANEVIELGSVTELTRGMMGVDIGGFQLQPHAGLSEA